MSLIPSTLYDWFLKPTRNDSGVELGISPEHYLVWFQNKTMVQELQQCILNSSPPGLPPYSPLLTTSQYLTYLKVAGDLFSGLADLNSCHSHLCSPAVYVGTLSFSLQKLCNYWIYYLDHFSLEHHICLHPCYLCVSSSVNSSPWISWTQSKVAVQLHISSIVFLVCVTITFRDVYLHLLPWCLDQVSRTICWLSLPTSK